VRPIKRAKAQLTGGQVSGCHDPGCHL